MHRLVSSWAVEWSKQGCRMHIRGTKRGMRAEDNGQQELFGVTGVNREGRYIGMDAGQVLAG